jgi:hypothetical protein
MPAELTGMIQPKQQSEIHGLLPLTRALIARQAGLTDTG